MTLDDSQYTQGINKAGESSTNFGHVASAAFAAVAVAATTMAVAVVKVGSDFEAQMSVVEAISGATGREMDALAEKAKYMGATTQFSATEAAEAFEYMAMAGWDASQMVDGLEGIMYAAGASGENLAMVSDIITDGLTAFGESADQAGRFADVLAAAAANSNTNIGMMGETFKYVAPVAGALGYSMEDTAVAIGLMANSGIKASQAGTTLRQIINNLVSPTDKVAGAMDDLGIQVTNLDGSMKPLDQLLRELRGSFDGLSEAEAAMYASTLAGQRGMSGLLAIIGAADEDFDNLTRAIDDSAGAAQQMNEVRIDNLQGDVVLLQSALEGLGIQIYDSFNAPLREAVQEGTKGINSLAGELAKPNMVKSLNTIADGFSTLIKNVSSFATTVIPPLVAGLGTAITVMTALRPVVVGVIAAFAAYKVVSGFSAALKVATQATTLFGQAELLTSGILTAGQTAVALLTGKISLLTVAKTAATAAAGLFKAATAALGGPVGIAIVAVAGLTAGVIALVKWFNRESEESKQLKEDIEALSDANDELLRSMDSSAEAHASNLKSIEAEAYASKNLIDRIYDLSQAENKSAQDKAVLVGYINMLNDSVEGLNLAYDAEADSLNMARDAALAYVDTLQTQLEAQAAQERYVELSKERYAAEEQILIIGQKLAEAQEEWGEESRKYYNETKDLQDELKMLEQQLADNAIAFEHASATIEDSVQSQAEVVADAFSIQMQVMEDYSGTLESMVESATDMFNRLSEESSIAIEDMIENLEHNQRVIAEWADNIAILAERGIDEGLLEQLRRAGPESAGLVAELVAADEAELERLSDVYSNGAESAMDAFLIAMGVPLQDGSFDEIGTGMMQGVATGIEGESESVIQAAIEAVLGANEGAREALGIHSPSTVFMEIGEYAMEGLSLGFEKGYPAAIQSATAQSKEFVTSVTAIVATLPDAIYDSIISARDRVNQWSVILINTGNTGAKSFVSGIVNIVSETPLKYYDAIYPTVGRVDEWISLLVGVAQTRLPTFVDTSVSIVGVLPSEFYTIGQETIEGLWAGIESKSSWFYSNLISFCKEIVRTAKRELDISSPSKVFMGIGAEVVNGFVVGVQKKQGEASRAVSSMVHANRFHSYDFDSTSSLNRATVVDRTSEPTPQSSLVINQQIQSVNHSPLENELAARAAFTRVMWG